jgi:hypothetical protein
MGQQPCFRAIQSSLEQAPLQLPPGNRPTVPKAPVPHHNPPIRPIPHPATSGSPANPIRKLRQSLPSADKKRRRHRPPIARICADGVPDWLQKEAGCSSSVRSSRSSLPRRGQPPDAQKSVKIRAVRGRLPPAHEFLQPVRELCNRGPVVIEHRRLLDDPS